MSKTSLSLMVSGTPRIGVMPLQIKLEQVLWLPLAIMLWLCALIQPHFTAQSIACRDALSHQHRALQLIKGPTRAG